MTETRFENVHGLSNSFNISTCEDLSKLID